MNLPTLIQSIYGEFAFTGLYSFEFVDKKRNTITEIFFMMPPKSKTVSESTRSSTSPTLGGNYNIDAGNATKNITLSGELWFPLVGSPDQPLARDVEESGNTIDGLNEFFKLRWMLIRYRDYTMTSNAKMTTPGALQSSEVQRLYKKVSKLVKEKIGALYDEVQVIFHDYDMDDHWYCRVDNFSSTQSDAKYNGIEYTITLECYEPDHGQKRESTSPKKSVEVSLDIVSQMLDDIDYDTKFALIQGAIGYNADALTTANSVKNLKNTIIAEISSVTTGATTATTLLPDYAATFLSNINLTLASFITVFLTPAQQIAYAANTFTIDELGVELLSYYNALQKMKLMAENIQGIIKPIPIVPEIRYSSSANDYTLTTEQFESSEGKVSGNTNFYDYTVLDGDTARIVALRELKDQEKFISILRANSISENDFIDGTLIGQKIKIPIDIAAASRDADNLVYESDYTNIDKFLFGSDITVGINKEFIVSETGDILGKIGVDNVFDNLETRLRINKGSLNVFSPNYGSVAIDDGNAPMMVKIDRYLTDVVGQITADPRVESVNMQLDKLVWSGDTISVPTTVYFIGTDETREVTA